MTMIALPMPPKGSQPPARINPAFGEAVRRIMGARSLRQTRILTGVDVDTLSRMRQDEVPRIDKVIDFARGFEQDVNAWLELAGYPRIEDPRSPLEVILDKSKELTYEPDLDTVTFKGFLAGPNVHPEDREALERIARAILAERRRKQGRN